MQSVILGQIDPEPNAFAIWAMCLPNLNGDTEITVTGKGLHQFTWLTNDAYNEAHFLILATRAKSLFKHFS